jgi:hypothetical protein
MRNAEESDLIFDLVGCYVDALYILSSVILVGVELYVKIIE